MPRVEPAGPRSTITETHDGLRIVVPARRNWFLIAFFGFWLTMWLSIGGTAVFTFAAGFTFAAEATRGGFALFTLTWSLFWAAAACATAYTWLWNVAGREVVIVSYRALSTQRRIGPIAAGRRSEYAAEHVRDLRPNPVPSTPRSAFGSSMRWGGMGAGGIAFDYGSRTHRFGDGLDEAEAKQLIALIQERLPDSG